MTEKSPDEALRQGAELFRLIVESAEDYAIFTTDFERRVTSWNTGAERLMGWSEAEFLGQSADLIFTPEDRRKGAPEKEAQKALAEGRARNQRWHLRKDGSRFWGDGLMHPLKDDAGPIRGFVKIFRDRTAELRAEEARHQAESDLRLMLESATDFAIFSLTPDGRVACWNTAAQRLFGYAEDEIIGQDVSVLFTPEDQADGLPQRDLETARERGRAEDERWHPRKDGSLFYLSGVCTPIRDEAGTLVGFTKVWRDISERHRVEAQLAEARERLDAALAAAEAGTWVYDIRRGIVTADANLARLFGMPPEEAARGASLEHFIARCHPDDQERVRRSFDEAIGGETRWESEHRSHQANGEDPWGIARAVVERDGRGRPLRMRGVGVDVPHRRRAEGEGERFFSVAADMLAVTGPDGYFKRVNPAWQEAFGWSPEEMTSRLWLDFVHPDDHEATIAEAKRLFEG